MRKVTGEEITLKELKNCYIGYYEKADASHTIEVIECNGYRYSMDEECRGIARYPVKINPNYFADYSELDSIEKREGITAYEFINNWWGLDEHNLEDFTFYFAK